MLLILAFGCAGVARGQAPTVTLLAPVPCSDRRVLTLADLENLALANNPTIPAAAAAVTQQQGLLRQATLYPNPVAGYLRTDADQQGQTLTAGAFFSQEIVTPGKIRLAKLAGEGEVQHSEWQLRAQKTRVINDVRIRYFELLGAQEALAAARELEALAADGVATAKKLLDIRQGSRPDVLQAEIQQSIVRATLDDARNRYESALRQLAHVVGMAELPSTAIEGRLDDALPNLDYQDCLNQTLANSPLLQAQQAQIQSTQYEVRLARLQAVPNVSVQLVAQRDSIQKYSTVSTLVALPVPFFNRNQGNILNAESQLVQHQREAERIRLAIMDQMAIVFRQYQSLRGQVDRLQREVLPRAKENLDLTNRGYELRQFDFPRVLIARQTYFQTKLAAIDGLTELRKVTIEIEGMLLTGGLNPTEVGAALQSQSASGLRGNLLQQLQDQRNSGPRNLPGAVQAGER